MGSVQRLATVVIIGLVALSTVLFLYLGDESSRIDAKADRHQEVAVERATSNFITLCMQCHGPAGEGLAEPGVSGTGRIGAPLGGINTSLNQEGVNASGTPFPGGVEARAQIIHDTIYDGLPTADGEGFRMPAFGGASGSLTDSQINELVTMIQHVDWNVVYNHAIEESGGYPTPPPAAAPPADEEETDQGAGSDEGNAALVIESHDISFNPTTLEIPADTDVTIELPNLGAAPHNFAIDELGISIDLAPGANESVVINAPPGEYEFYCNVPGHKEAGMHGILTVTEGYELPAASADSGEEPAADSASTDDAASGDEGGEAAAGESFAVVSHDISFDPTELTIPADTDVTLSLPNEGAAPHNFTIEELDISVDQAPGEMHGITINAPAGTYEYYCDVPGHRESGMVGTLTVE